MQKRGGASDGVALSCAIARVVQDGSSNEATLAQKGQAPQVARIAQNGDSNRAAAEQDGVGSSDLGLAQEGDDNSAVVLQRR